MYSVEEFVDTKQKKSPLLSSGDPYVVVDRGSKVNNKAMDQQMICIWNNLP